MSVDLKWFHKASHAAAQKHLHHATAHSAGEHLGHGTNRHQIGHQIRRGIAKDKQSAAGNMLTQMHSNREYLQQGCKATGEIGLKYLLLNLNRSASNTLTTDPPQWT